MTGSHGLSTRLFRPQAGPRTDDGLKTCHIGECFGSLAFGRIAGLANHALREVIIQIAVLGWNIGCTHDPVLRVQKLMAARSRAAAILGSGDAKFGELLEDFISRKEALFPWLRTEVGVSELKVTDDAVEMLVTTAATTHRMKLMSSAPIDALGSFCRAIEEIASCTEIQAPLLIRILDVPNGLTDIDKTKITSIYSCQAGNLVGYEQLVARWSQEPLSDAQRVKLREAKRNIASAQSDTAHLLKALLSQSHTSRV